MKVASIDFTASVEDVVISQGKTGAVNVAAGGTATTDTTITVEYAKVGAKVADLIRYGNPTMLKVSGTAHLQTDSVTADVVFTSSRNIGYELPPT